MSSLVSLAKTVNGSSSVGSPKPFHHGNLRQALIEAALAAPDIEGLSLRQIATGLGVTPAAAYRHFESREGLLNEVARIGFDRLADRFAVAFDLGRPPADAGDARSRLARLAQAYLEFADEEPALWRLLFGVQGASFRDTARLQNRQAGYEYLPAALLGLHCAHVIRRAPDERDALFAWSAIHGAASLRAGQIAAAQLPLEVLANEVAARVIRSMQ